MLSIDAKRQLAEHVSVHGTAYFRHGNRGTSNGDEAEFTLCDGSVPSVLCDGDGRQLRDEAGRPFVTDDPYNAVFNTTQTVTDGIGGSLLIHVQERFAGRPNHLVVGATFDGSRIAFLQQAEVGWLTLDRGVQGIGVHLEDPGFHTDLAVQNQAVGVYATDTWTPVEPLSFNLSARMNWLHTKLNDRLGSALDGSHGFVRVNPSIGLTYRPIKPVTFFANYAESNRAPSAAELSCADPTQPCRVPNAFISDPALEQVVSRSLEVGLRGRVGPASHPNLIASLAAFGSRNEHDILFVAGSLVGTGYFQNAGRTQRIGLEASLQGDAGPCQWYATYTLLRATFESELELPGGANPAANSDDAGDNLEVETGSRIPGLPTHTAKAGLSIRPVEPLQLGLEIHGQSSQPLRGDEANALRDVHGFMIVSAHASYQLFEQLELFLRARNILDTKYSTFGVVADPSEVLSGASNPRFLGVGAPFGIWGGIVVTDLL
jgi:outer membrane receptor protein involved in Fe transport